MKKTILCLLIAAMTMGTVPVFADTAAPAAAETAVVETAPAEITKMTISDAIAYAEEHSPAVIAEKLKVKYCEESLALARSNRNSMIGKSAESDEMFLIKSGYRYSQAEAALKNAERNLYTALTTSKATVSQYFYTYISNTEKVKIAETALEQAKTRLTQAEAKYNLGSLSALDVNNFKTDVLSAENNLAKAKRTLDISMEQFKNHIGFPQENPIELSGSLEINENTEILPLEEARAIVIEKSPTILSLKDSIALEERMMKTYEAWYPSNTFAYRVQKAIHDQTMHGYQMQYDATILSVSTIRDSVVTAKEGLALLESKYENTKKTYEVVKAQYEMGMVPATDFIDISQAMTNIENSILDTKVAVILAINSYGSLYNEDYDLLITEQQNTVNK